MIIVLGPDDAAKRSIQSAESAIYFSELAPYVLRQIGMVSPLEVYQKPVEASAFGTVVLRGFSPERMPLGMLAEGPVDLGLLEDLGISADRYEAEQIHVRTAIEKPFPLSNGSRIRLAYPRLNLRKIPARKGQEFGEPYTFLSEDGTHGDSTISFQIFEQYPDSWTPIVSVEESARHPGGVIGLTDGARLVLGFPLMDLLGSLLYVPTLPHGYYSAESNSRPFELHNLLYELLEFSLQPRCSPLQIGLWPVGKRWAFSVRHDYDRLITDLELNELLVRYSKKGIRCTWCTLQSRSPIDQLHRISSQGHEIALHTEARIAGEFEEEMATLRSKGFVVQGATAHGGIGALGFVGGKQYRWFRSKGLAYGELLGVLSTQPHPVPLWDGEQLVVSKLMVPACHVSLESSTADLGDEGVERVLKSAGILRSSGGHLNLMNHPDLAREALYRCLDEIPHEDAFKGTLLEVGRWVQRSRFSYQVEFIDDHSFLLSFPDELPEAAWLRAGAGYHPGSDDHYAASSVVATLHKRFSGSLRVYLVSERKGQQWEARAA